MPARSTTEVLKSNAIQRDLAISLIVVVLLSVDWLNPVKVVALALGVPSRWFAYPCVILLGHLFLTHYQEIVYDGVRVFFRSILSIFFRQVDIVGIDNIPKHGPIVFSGNHSNQFVDGIMVLTTAQHRVGFLIAEKSYNHPVVGFFAKLAGAVPVKRPQDSAKTLPGTIKVEGAKVTGQGTAFLTDLRPGDKLRIKGQADGFRISSIASDTSLRLAEDEALPSDVPAGFVAYEKLAKVDQSRVYNAVFDSLKHGNCIGIFPEGGSHDRTDLLPLKVGIALIAFGMAEKYNITVPIVPVGLNYFRGHRFRGRVVVEFGPPIRIPEELLELYRVNRKEAYQKFLLMVEDGMRATLVTAPNYYALHLVYTARRLFQKDNWLPSPSEKMDMNRRFAEGYKMLIQKYGDDLPDEVKQLESRIMDYQKTLHGLGLRDYQVPTLEEDNLWKLMYSLSHLLLVFTLAMLPSIILNAPVGLIARVVSTREQKKALAASRVKIEAKDVVMSKKITLAIVLVPTLWTVYALLLLSLSSLRPATVAVLFFCCPLFSYIGVMATEAGMVDFKDLKPVLMRFLPWARRKMQTLPAERAQLQKDVRAFIHKVGPELGDLYSAKEVKWEEVLRRTPSGTDLASLIDNAAAHNHSGNGAADLSGLAAAVNGRETPTPDDKKKAV